MIDWLLTRQSTPGTSAGGDSCRRVSHRSGRSFSPAINLQIYIKIQICTHFGPTVIENKTCEKTLLEIIRGPDDWFCIVLTLPICFINAMRKWKNKVEVAKKISGYRYRYTQKWWHLEVKNCDGEIWNSSIKIFYCYPLKSNKSDSNDTVSSSIPQRHSQRRAWLITKLISHTGLNSLNSPSYSYQNLQNSV